MRLALGGLEGRGAFLYPARSNRQAEGSTDGIDTTQRKRSGPAREAGARMDGGADAAVDPAGSPHRFRCRRRTADGDGVHIQQWLVALAVARLSGSRDELDRRLFGWNSGAASA